MSFINKNPDIQRALRFASAHFGRQITLESLQHKQRIPHYSRPRFYVAAFLRRADSDKFSYPAIARLFKFKNHTSVFYGEREAFKLWGADMFNRAARNYRSPCADEIMMIGEANLAKWRPVSDAKVFTNARGWEVAA